MLCTRLPAVPDFDPEKYDRVGGTSAGAYHLLEPGIVVAIPNPGYRQTVEGARASLEEVHRIARDRAELLVVLVLLEPVRDQDRGSRQVWNREIDEKLLAGLGLVGVSPLARAVGSFFMGLTRPKIPTALLKGMPQA